MLKPNNEILQRRLTWRLGGMPHCKAHPRVRQTHFHPMRRSIGYWWDKRVSCDDGSSPLISLEIKSPARKPGDVRGSAILGVPLIIGSSLTPNAYKTPKPRGVPRK